MEIVDKQIFRIGGYLDRPKMTDEETQKLREETIRLFREAQK